MKWYEVLLLRAESLLETVERLIVSAFVVVFLVALRYGLNTLIWATAGTLTAAGFLIESGLLACQKLKYRKAEESDEKEARDE